MQDAGSDAVAPDASADDSGVEGGVDSGADLVCTKTSDCSKGVCCAEIDQADGQTVVITSCLPNCITDVPRFRVCASAAECESGECRAFDCGRGAPAVRFCDKPDVCQ